jgi:ferredoxin
MECRTRKTINALRLNSRCTQKGEKMPPVIDTQKCISCGTCEDICPLDVIYMKDEAVEVRYPLECWHCGACRQDCPQGAVSYEFTPIMLHI